MTRTRTGTSSQRRRHLARLHTRCTRVCARVDACKGPSSRTDTDASTAAGVKTALRAPHLVCESRFVVPATRGRAQAATELALGGEHPVCGNDVLCSPQQHCVARDPSVSEVGHARDDGEVEAEAHVALSRSPTGGTEQYSTPAHTCKGDGELTQYASSNRDSMCAHSAHSVYGRRLTEEERKGETNLMF